MGDFQVGSTVRIRQGARDMNYGCLFASFVYNRDYTVLEIRGDRIVFGWSNGAITGVTQRSNIIYNGGSGGESEVSNKSVAPSNPDDYSWGSVKNDFADAAVGESERFTCSTNEDISSGHKLANYFTAYARTYYHFTRDVVIINKFTSDDGATLYLNNVAIGHNDAYTGNDPNGGCEVHMHFQKGWNLVEVVVHEVTPPCWWNFKIDPKTNKYCDGQSSLSDYLDAHSIKWYFNKFTDGTGFKIGTNELTDEKYKLAFDQEETVTARLLSAVKAFDGEMSYSFTIKGLAIIGLHVNFFKKRGKETDIELRYGREISNITSKTSIENLATALKATGSNIDAYNHVLTLYGYQYDDGDIYVDQTDGILKSRTALAYYHRYQFGTGEGHITKTFNYDTTNQATLFAKAYEELKKVSVPEINYEVTIQIPPKNVHIGDTIRIIDEKGGLYLRARVIKLVRSFYQNELTITLGDYLIESSQISKQIKDLAQQFALMQQTMPRYTWYAYADDPDGTNISMYPYDSETDNLTGVTTYTHFRKYVGIAYNMSSASVSLSDPKIFQWSLIKGEDGIPGSNGADGKTYYFHVAYANKADNGTIIDFSTTNPDGRAYIGTYSDEYQPDATVPTAYKWQLVKGKDGESSIAHLAYANKDDNGNIIDFSTTDNTNRKWLGVYVDYYHDAPNDPSLYTWSKIVGDDGYSPEVSVSKSGGVATITVKGKDGVVTTTTVADGKDGTSIKGDKGDTAYVHIAYATSSDGSTGFSTSWFSGATYIGIRSDNTKADPTSASSYEWSLIKGKDGHSPVVAATKSGDTTTITVDGKEQAEIKDGISVRTSSNSITYQVGTSPTTAPTGTWSSAVPTVPEGQYLWSKTVVVYTDGASTTTYSVARQGVTGPKGDKGDTGATGANGADGISPTVSVTKSGTKTTISITDKNGTHTQTVNDGVNGTPGAKGADGKTPYFHVKYSNDGGSTFTSNGGETVGTYIGTCTDYNSADPTTVSSYTWARIKGDKGERGLQGLQGEKGEQGIPGQKGDPGTDGKTSYFHIKYSSVASPSTSSDMSETPAAYIGTYVDFTYSDSTDPKKYTWTQFRGSQGPKGDKGIAGTNGTNGKTSYLHIAYATSADGKTGFSVSDSAGKTYIGQYTDFTESDSTDYTKYSWTLIKGEKGDTGATGAKGATGPKGDSITITSSSTTYATSTSSTQPADSAFTATSIPTLAAGDYLWTKVVTNFSDGKSVKSYSVSRIGADGKTGATGANGKTTHWAYATSADGKTGFSTIMFSGATYVGTYDDTNQADSTDYTKYKWTKLKGDTGAKGADGKGIKSTAVAYQASSSQTTAPSGTWVTSVPTLSASNPYLWTRTVITYTDNSTSTSYSVGSTLEGVNVGGRNLLKNSHKGEQTYSYPSSDRIDCSSWVTSIPLNGDTYTLSFWAKSTVAGDRIRVHFYNPSNITHLVGSQGQIKSGANLDGSCDFTLSTVLTKYWVTYTIPKNGNATRSVIIPRLFAGGAGSGTITVKWEKVEEGNIATDWTPAPEDVDARINSTIIKHEQEYYLSTSDTSLAGGSWSTTFPTRKDGTFYWVRYKDTHANNAVTYDPSANGKLLTEVNEVWNSVVSNKTAINSSNAQINMVATSVTSVKNDLSKKADTESVNSSMDKLSSTVTDIGKQIADLKVKANSIEASVTEVNNLAQTTKKATAALTADGLSVDTGQTTKSVVDGTGLTITSKADNSVVAKFTTGESEIQNLKIDGFMRVGAHIVQKMQDTEWDGTTVNGTGWMWNGG